MREILGSNFVVEADLVFLSMGFLDVEDSPWLSELGVQYTPQGNISTMSNYETSIKGIFAAGDVVTGHLLFAVKFITVSRPQQP